jgi:hypothetical protein
MLPALPLTLLPLPLLLYLLCSYLLLFFQLALLASHGVIEHICKGQKAAQKAYT